MSLRARIQLLVLALLLLGLASAVGTVVLHQRVQDTQLRLRQSLRPAQATVVRLHNDYANQVASERGYLLTGNSSYLLPYRADVSATPRLERTLENQASDQRATVLVLAVVKAGRAWENQAATPDIAQRQSGALTGALPASQARTDRQLFTVVTTRLVALDARINTLVTNQQAEVAAAQDASNWLALAAGLAALAIAVVIFLVLRRSLSRPLDRLVGQVGRVAGGDLDHSVDATGPPELSAVGQAVETMRTRLLEEAAQRARVQRHLALVEEDKRIARDLHDRVIQRLYGTALLLQSIGRRHPELANRLSGATGEIDEAIKELRSVIFGLTDHQEATSVRQRLLNLARGVADTAGLTPKVRFDGPVDTAVKGPVADHLLAVLRELLSNITRHAHASSFDIDLSVHQGTLRLVVSDDGLGINAAHLDSASLGTSEGSSSRGDGLDNVADRARQLGGRCSVIPGEHGGTEVTWEVPISDDGRQQSSSLTSSAG